MLDREACSKIMFFYRVQCLEDNLEDLERLSLDYWVAKFVQEVAYKKGGRYPPRSLYEIVIGLKQHLEDLNRGNALKQCARNV